MASLGMDGPYELTSERIDEHVTRTSAGNYALGKLNDKKEFVFSYVGRADSDVNGRLKRHASSTSYTRFKFSYASSPKAAFEKECKNYHDFGGDKGELENKIHPDRPDDADWQCPVCDKFKPPEPAKKK